MRILITILFLLTFLQIVTPTAFAQIQSHPLSEVTPINVNLNMSQYSIFNASWINATNVNATSWVNSTFMNASKIYFGIAGLLKGNPSLLDVRNAEDTAAGGFRAGIIVTQSSDIRSTNQLMIKNEGGTALQNLTAEYFNGTGMGLGTTSIGNYRLNVIGDIKATWVNASSLNVSGAAYIQGNVGIGTTGPQAPLHVTGNAVITASLYFATGPATPQLYKSSNDLRFVASNAYDFRNSPDSASVMYIQQTGNVGIGTTNPTQKLYINGSSPNITIHSDTVGPAGILWNYAAEGQKMYIRYDYSGNGLLDFGGKMGIVAATGNVGIGTTNPQQKLDVVGNINTTQSLIASSWVNASSINASTALYAQNIREGGALLTDKYIELTDSFGGDVSGTYNNLLVLRTQGLSAGNITSGTISIARLDNNLAWINISKSWTAAQNFGDNINWTNLTSYPPACSAGQAITALGDTPTCNAFLTSETYTGDITDVLAGYGITVDNSGGPQPRVNLSSAAAGNALTYTNGVLDVVPGTGLEISTDTIRIAAAAAGNGLTGGGGSALAVAAGSGITVDATTDTVNHTDTSSQASSDNSGNTFIQDVTLDTYGHLTGLATATVAETDPQVGTTTNTYVCYGDGSAVQCADAGITYATGTDTLSVGVLQIAGTTVIDSSRNIIAGTWVNASNLNASAAVYGQTIYEGGTALSSKYAGTTHAHSASDINSGTLSNARLDSNIAWVNKTQTFTAAQTINSLTLGGNMNAANYDIYGIKNVNTTNLFATGNVGIGTTSPATNSKLHVVGGNITVSNDTVARGNMWWDATNNRLVIQVA